jgi:hypothetical protein
MSILVSSYFRTENSSVSNCLVVNQSVFISRAGRSLFLVKYTYIFSQHIYNCTYVHNTYLHFHIFTVCTRPLSVQFVQVLTQFMAHRPATGAQGEMVWREADQQGATVCFRKAIS